MALRKTSVSRTAPVPANPVLDESPPVAAAPVPPAPVAPARPAQLFKARRFPVRHPYQNVLVPVTHGVYLVLDSWVQAQLQAKVIERA